MKRTEREIMDIILEGRGILRSEQETFLNPDFVTGVHDPALMKGMKIATDRLALAIRRKEKIAIFGDYDADGVPATALLVRAFARLGVEVTALIPTRADGYGLTMSAADTIKNLGIQVLITVDNGTVSGTEIEYLLQSGIETIVCDHHEPQVGHIAEKALAILNPKQDDCPYPFKGLCGCAIAWKLACSLYSHLGVSSNSLKWELDLVALSTIADMVPLLGENRVLARYGTTVFRKSRNYGLQALASQANLQISDISAGGISFGLAPRINAPSRMHSETIEGVNASLQLLVTNDKKEAARLAAYLDDQNKQRQLLLEQHLEEARAQAEMYKEDCCLVLYTASWSTGVIGLLAGRLMEQYKRPVVILANEELLIKGSVRSVDGVDSVEMITAGAQLLLRFGGHTKAAGLTFSQNSEDDVREFRRRINGWLQQQGHTVASLQVSSRKKSELELDLGEITLSLVMQLQKLEPFGIGFPAPLFNTICNVSQVRRVGATNQHLACFLKKDGVECKAIGFQLGDTQVDEKEIYDVYINPQEEVWQSKRSVSCHIRSITPVNV